MPAANCPTAFRKSSRRARPHGRARLIVALALATTSAGCSLFSSSPKKPGEGEEHSAHNAPSGAKTTSLPAPMSSPSERDDPKAPILRIAQLGSSRDPVGVPYLYGYPLCAEGATIDGIRLLRNDNWTGATREEQTEAGGLIRIVETLPAIGCTLTAIKEDQTKYVPLELSCELPVPKDRGGPRPVVGSLNAGAKVDAVLNEPSLKQAFLGEWHATSPDFSNGFGTGYFDTPSGLLGLGFEKGKLARVTFVFDATEKSWRKPELWTEPLAYTVGQ